jgi:hypothetical protein
MIANALRRLLASLLVVAMVAAPLSQLAAARADACESVPTCQMSGNCCCAATVEVSPDNSAVTTNGCNCEISESESPTVPPIRATVTETTDVSQAEILEPPVAWVLTYDHRSSLSQSHGPPGEHSPPRYISNCSFLI